LDENSGCGEEECVNHIEKNSTGAALISAYIINPVLYCAGAILVSILFIPVSAFKLQRNKKSTCFLS
jgi:hypothetical protein